MNEIVQAQVKLPAHIAAALATIQDDDDSLSSGVGAGYPVVSIRGRAWRIVQNGEEKVVTLPNSDDPAPAIEVVVLKANKALSKVYYAKAYVEGSNEEPDCFSNDGISPDPAVEAPQSPRCATCPHNVWGSKITPQGSKTKACSDSRRVAVAPAGDLTNPMLLRVPAATLADLAEYGRTLKRRGIPFYAVITKLGFDANAAYPKITFKPVRFPDEEQFGQINEARANPVIEEIVGQVSPSVRREAAPAVAPSPPSPPPPPAPAPTPAAPPAAMETDAALDDLLAEKPQAPAQVVEMPKGKRTTKAKPAEPTVVQAGSDLEQALDGLLDGFDT